MSELISNIELKKADGAPIKFNFQFENGLPIKPIIEVPYKIWMSKKTEELGVTIKINQSITTSIHEDNIEYEESIPDNAVEVTEKERIKRENADSC